MEKSWDDGFPDKWMAFLSRNLWNVQSNLRNALAECETGSSRKPVPMTYQNFASGIYQTYCRNWCDAPGDDVFVEMNDTFFAKCAIVVLKDHGLFSTFIPSWVFNVVNEEFFSLLHQYMNYLTGNPLSLVQLCRKALSSNGSSLLINLFRTIERQDIRECLFHMCYPE
ncbi:Hypothetical predicted protein [Paramuricea clavata]|uniref:Uncharacterized protein n=1 Tax=Paramuricea clavata TaxID=317549 RepID=A0A7D9EUS9_PARCT|nr:Hypothetical predicted protein [Paramuricea clavata]